VHEPLIDQELFETYRALRQGRIGRVVSKTPKDFSGMLVCTECGGNLSPNASAHWQGWRCWQSAQKGAHGPNSIATVDLEEAWLGWLREHAQRDETVAER